jgi:hypothetical protein
MVDNKPIHQRKSAVWCRQAVDQCWKMKHSNIQPEERDAAEATYNRARNIYDKIIEESPGE